MSFYLRLDRIAPAKPASLGIAFEFSLHNRVPRTVTILSLEFELWMLPDQAAAAATFLAPLVLDLREDFVGAFGPHDQRPLRLLWHWVPKQVQLVEEGRKGGDLMFEIRGQMAVASTWQGQEGRTEPLRFEWERPFYSTTATGGSYPIHVAVPRSDWAKVLDAIDFKHISLIRVPLGAFPPALSALPAPPRGRMGAPPGRRLG